MPKNTEQPDAAGGVDFGLSPERKKELEIEVRKKLQAEAQKREEDEYKAALELKLRREELANFHAAADAEGDGLHPHTLNLAPHSDRITINGKQYLHGRLYHFTDDELRTIKDIEHRTWQHESEIGGAYTNATRSKYHAVVRPN